MQPRGGNDPASRPLFQKSRREPGSDRLGRFLQTTPRVSAAGRLIALVLLAFVHVQGEVLGSDVPAVTKAGPPAAVMAVAKPVVYEYPRTNARLAAAIERGVAYLKKTDAFRLGGRALSGLTLLSCGVDKKDAAVVRLAKSVRAGLPQLTATYERSLCLLFLDMVGDVKDRKWVRRIALQLIAGQGILGGWSYKCPTLSAAQEQALLEALKSAVRYAAKTKIFVPRPVESVRTLPALQYRPGQALRFQPTGWEDNSLTQFVILALWRAQNDGIPVSRSLSMVEARFRASQAPDGSWAYRWTPEAGNFRADSMTCAGLLGLAVSNGIQQGQREGPSAAGGKLDRPRPARLGDQAIERGLLFLSQRIGGRGLQKAVAEKAQANAQMRNLQTRLAQAGLAERPTILKQIQDLLKEQNNIQTGGTILGANSRGDLYFLWSVERVAVAYDLRTIGGKDWYAWGTPFILAHQQLDGSWSDFFPGVPDTCFALLFLKRANVALDLTRNLFSLPLARETASRMSDPFHGMSPGQFSNLAMPKGR